MTQHPRFPARSVTASWAALVAVDLVGRAGFLLPRLETLRGLCNYAAASLALWIVLRLVVMVRPRPRVALFAAFVAAPMAIQWGMFRAYGQFIEPTDLVELADSPRVALSAIATGAGSYGIGGTETCAPARESTVARCKRPATVQPKAGCECSSVGDARQ